MSFKLSAPYKPSWDQPKAIDSILKHFENNENEVVLLGATGTGKTFTMANIVKELNLPTLVLSHNKTLAAQLTTEFKYFFPSNAVHYFVSYFDFYQPESYLPDKDIYLEKDSAINKDIEMYRLAAMSSLISRQDVLVVSSVSALYGLGTRDDFEKYRLFFEVWKKFNFKELKKKLLLLQYKPVKWDMMAWTFDFRWDMLDIFSSIENVIYRIIFDEETIDMIEIKDSISWVSKGRVEKATIWPSTQFIQNLDNIDKILKEIEIELKERVKYFKWKNDLLYAQRIWQKVRYDLKMIKETWFTNGIENYSRYFDQRKHWEPPNVIFDYFPDTFLLIVDESHMTIPQFYAMPSGDASRKTNLIDYGFRLPSAIDHRPFKFQELEFLLSLKSKKQIIKELPPDTKKEFIDQLHISLDYLARTWRPKKKVYVLFVSATPANYELSNAKWTVEQIIRPTWLLDPITYIYPKSWDYDILDKSLEKLLKKEPELKKLLENYEL